MTDKPFFTLTAGDLMSRHVLTVPRSMSLRGAARLLSKAQVSGAPVVDDQGRCIGVLSSTDFVHCASEEGVGKPPKPAEPCYCADWLVAETEQMPDHEVGDVMTPDPVMISPETTVGELAQRMVDAHIHRLIVVDETCRPVGIVSSMDVLAAVARVAPPVTFSRK